MKLLKNSSNVWTTFQKYARSGQKFIDHAIAKVAELKTLITKTGASTKIEVDGGVNTTTGASLVNAGADALVAGSFVFKSDDPKRTIADLRSL